MTTEVNALQKRKQVEGLVKLGMYSVTGLVVAPYVFLAIKGIMGLLALCGIGLLAVNVVPALSNMLANWSLKAIKAEAEKNPIETLELDYGKQENRLEQYKESITGFSASVKTFEDKLESFRSEFPQDTDKFDEQLKKMKRLLEIRVQNYKEAKKQTEHYYLEIQRAKAIWKMSLEAAKMNKASGISDEDFLQKIKVETSLDSVETSMNRAFAELETSLIEEDDEKELGNVEMGKPTLEKKSAVKTK